MPLHLVLLGNLPGAPAADLKVSPPTSFAVAPSMPSRNNGSSSSSSSSWSSSADTMESAVHTCQDASCPGDTLANSAHHIDRNQLFRGERWQCRTMVPAPLLAACLHLACELRRRRTRTVIKAVGRCGGGRWTRTDTRTVIKIVGRWVGGGATGRSRTSSSNCATLLPREIQKICVSSCANLATTS